ncbi:MAG: patatin-like phospholipase family protein [Erythrobacter sp.]
MMGMGRTIGGIGAALAALVVAGCQNAPITPDNLMCDFRTIRLNVAIPVSRPADLAQRAPSPLAAEIEASLRAHDRLQLGEKASLLSLSGGSEHGAFGAGVFAGWGGDGNLPDFQVVTGISTGSILATFAFVNDADGAVEGYTINSESELIDIYVKPKGGPNPTLEEVEGLITHGAVASLEPLRKRLGSFITDDVLAKVASRHASGARLLVGATDADTGDAVAFDLGDMAARYVKTAPDDEGRGLIKDCYLSAIIASSSTPLASPPAFIDNTMYIDGGTRFGLFGDSVIEAFYRRQQGLTDAYQLDEDEEDNPLPVQSLAPIVYAIIDGTLQLPPRHCPKADQSLCTAERPMGGRDGAHKDWNLLGLALNTKGILVNEVYRFSALSVAADACEEAGCFNILRIEPDVSDFEYIIPDANGVLVPANCPQWRQVDIDLDHPVQFHKRYMRCLIAYGEAQVQAAGWGAGS